MQPALALDPEFAEHVELANATYLAAISAITTIASLNVLFELKGDDQIEKAAHLLQHKKDDIVKILAKRLQSVVDGNVKSATQS